jgi:phosphatidylinositol alpha-mannosyltransferase
LRDWGHSVDIVAGSFGARDNREHKAKRIGRCIFVPLNKSYAVLPVGFDVPGKIRWCVEGSGYDVIHLNGPIFPNLSFFALKYSKAKNVATFHTSSEKVQGFGNTFFKKVFSSVNGKIDIKIAVSEEAKRTNKFYVPGKYYVIPPGVETRIYTPAGDVDDAMGTNTVLFVGRMDPRKGLDRLIKAFPYVKKRLADARLVVVGQGPLYKRYARMAAEENISDCVSFEGYAHSGEEIARYFRSATVYTSPAIGKESFGIVLIEAMASGTPVVASDIMGYKGVIEHGRNGLLVDTTDRESYAAALVELMNDSKMRRKVIAEGLHDVYTKYSWDVVAGKIEQLYYT